MSPAQPEQQLKEHAEEPRARRSRSERARTGGLFVLAILATVFAVLNTTQVTVDWIIGSGKAPLIVVILVSLLAGIVLSYGADRLSRRRRR